MYSTDLIVRISLLLRAYHSFIDAGRNLISQMALKIWPL